MRSCRRSLTQYFDHDHERRRYDKMACGSVASWNGNGYGNGCSSGYVTCTSLSDEELLVMNGEEEEEKTMLFSEKRSVQKEEEEEERSESRPDHPGICPHCKLIYKKPVTLQCGHSLCAHCCSDLLSRIAPAPSIPRPRPRMGISSYSRPALSKALTSSWKSSLYSVWKSPQCILCGESAKMSPPVPNLCLEAFLTTIRLPPALRHLYDRQNKDSVSDSPLSPSSPISPISPLSPLSLSLSTGSECPLPSRVSIRDCTISIVGSKGTGKSSLLQTQLCNDMMIDELLGGRAPLHSLSPLSPLSDVSSLRSDEKIRRGSRYMLKLMETGDLADKISRSMGVVVTYSIIDRDSFHDAHRLLSIFTAQRGNKMPMVLVGTKSDLDKRRNVESYEGQAVAKQFNCPFLEVSSRRNECVNEAFIELVRVMESRCLLN